MLVLVYMGMQMLVHKFAMPVHVLMDKICRHQQLQIIHYGSGVPVHLNRMIFANDNRAGADLLDNIQVMGGGNDRLSGPGECLDKFDEPYLSAGIKTSGWFIQQDDIRIRGEDRRDTDLFLFTTARAYGVPGPAGFLYQAS